MEKSKDTIRTTTSPVELEVIVQEEDDPRLEAANAQFDAPLSMEDINNRNEALAEQRRQRQPNDLTLPAADYRKAIEAAVLANPNRSIGNRKAVGKTALTYREAIGY